MPCLGGRDEIDQWVAAHAARAERLQYRERADHELLTGSDHGDLRLPGDEPSQVRATTLSRRLQTGNDKIGALLRTFGGDVVVLAGHPLRQRGSASRRAPKPAQGGSWRAVLTQTRNAR